MHKGLPFLLPALGLAFLLYNTPLSNGRRQLADLQFDAAKKAFNRQDYSTAHRLALSARSNVPESAAPLLLIGHCFYLQGQDQAARQYYAQALRIDPHPGHLPPFLDLFQRADSPAPQLVTLTAGQLRSLRKKIGQMIMVSVPGTELSGQKKMMLNAGWIGGVILFNQNVQSKAQISRYVEILQENSPTPLFVAVDQEGGSVRRFREEQGFQNLPSLAALGKTQSPDLAYRFGRLSGKQLREAGANLNLAPVVDIDYELPDSIISKYHRSLGRDPEMISNLASEIVRGMRSQNVIAAAKHFPTQSIAGANPHEKVSVSSVSSQELERWDFLPYRRMIEKNQLDAVMLSHVVYKSIDPLFPASLSPEMIQGYLRKKLGYQGLVISDDLRMDAIKRRYPLEVSVVQAVNAGVDVLLVTDNYEKRVMETLVQAVQSGKVGMKSIDEAYNRITRIKAKYGLTTALMRKTPNTVKTEKKPMLSPPPMIRAESPGVVPPSFKKIEKLTGGTQVLSENHRGTGRI